MRILLSLILFYQKLIVPALVFALSIGLLSWLLSGEFSKGLIGISYIFSSLLFQYLIYEIRNVKEYYFYFNMGLSKPVLWLSTLFISIFIAVIISII
jgi:hypothetical protein